MKFIKKVSAGVLLSFGFIFLMISAVEILTYNQKPTPQEQQKAADTIIGGLVFGLPAIAYGGWLVWSMRKQHQKLLSDRLQSTFYHMVEENSGTISLLSFAKQAEISGEEARQYLDAKAKEFNATFDINSQGGVYYHFHV
ncbi:hypothetical protein [Fischerella thermalis]|uniref:hypothetical protein n=1 Tax=Fischerella thermalis TaxID=372787 RepID=UPI0019D8595B|nr:hypothetical protein [Fischerella thermalis]MBF1988015.1 hypothetical protein [Fischerella thermalis M58_A2018_009]MBF2060638.1 hypothetical protein [Fischerella thermalis M66_A2018_004]MBF2068462.1 hypothetical protein [Fischerella thermalis M48_A2018_028]